MSKHGFNPTHAQRGSEPPNAKSVYEVTEADLPLNCPLDSMSLWNSHPRVYLPIEEAGRAKCPYCGTEYLLVERS